MNIIMLNVFNNKILKKIRQWFYMDYIEPIQEIDLSLFQNTKKYSRKKIPDNKRCMGRKIDGLRCTRSKIHDKEFCRSHLKSLPNGRIDDGKIFTKNKLKKGKNSKYNSDEYVCVYKKTINNCIYLLDDDNYVYKNNLITPSRIGRYNMIEDKINYFTKNNIISV